MKMPLRKNLAHLFTGLALGALLGGTLITLRDTKQSAELIAANLGHEEKIEDLRRELSAAAAQVQTLTKAGRTPADNPGPGIPDLANENRILREKIMTLEQALARSPAQHPGQFSKAPRTPAKRSGDVADKPVATLAANGNELLLPAGVYIPTDNKILLNGDQIAAGKVSVSGGARSEISFANKTDEDLYVFWVDYAGKPTFSAKLKPGQSHGGITSEGQVHVVTRANGDVFGYIEPVAGGDDIDLEK
jgi:hypothetical protein